MTIRDAFSSRLKSSRERLQLTQEELGIKSGMAGMDIQQFEQGRRLPSLYSFAKLCRALKVKADYLIGHE